MSEVVFGMYSTITYKFDKSIINIFNKATRLSFIGVIVGAGVMVVS